MVRLSSPEFAYHLHNQTHGKNFTFALPELRHAQPRPEGLLLVEPEILWRVSFYDNVVGQHFWHGLQRTGVVTLDAGRLKLEVESITEEDSPDFSARMCFQTLSPVVIVRKNGGSDEYLSPCDSGYSELFTQNLKRRAQKSGVTNTGFLLWRLLGEQRSKLIAVKGIKIRGFMFCFELLGTAELLRFGYYAGFGSKCSMGFGCARVLGM